MNILLKYGKNASSNKVNWGPEALGNPVFRPGTACGMGACTVAGPLTLPLGSGFSFFSFLV